MVCTLLAVIVRDICHPPSKPSNNTLTPLPKRWYIYVYIYLFQQIAKKSNVIKTHVCRIKMCTSIQSQVLFNHSPTFIDFSLAKT